MEKQRDKDHGLFEDDDLDTAIGNVDDTVIVKSQQQIVEGVEIEHLPREQDEEEQPE